jgi:hypothetical protein
MESVAPEPLYLFQLNIENQGTVEVKAKTFAELQAFVQ